MSRYTLINCSLVIDCGLLRAQRLPLPAANTLTALLRVGAQATAFTITPKERSVGLSGRRSALSGQQAAVYL
jgi:hypothetical protein